MMQEINRLLFAVQSELSSKGSESPLSALDVISTQSIADSYQNTESITEC